jgi:hypothetical protein
MSNIKSNGSSRLERRPIIINQNSPYVSINTLDALTSGTVVTLTVPSEHNGKKVSMLGIMGFNGVAITREKVVRAKNGKEYIYNVPLSDRARKEQLKIINNCYGICLNLMNNAGVPISGRTVIGITTTLGKQRKIWYPVTYQDICQKPDISEWLLLHENLALSPGQTLSFEVLDNCNSINIEQVQFRCGFDLYFEEI